MARPSDEDVSQRAILEAVVDTIDSGILVVDNDQEFIIYNRKFVEMWDIPQTVMETGEDGRAIQAVLDDLERPAEFRETVEFFYQHPTESGDSRIHLQDGRVFRRYTAPVSDADTHYGRIWHFRDITDRIEREREVEEQKEQLNEYASVVSHDLRNPLNVAQGQLELARRDCESDALDRIEAAHDRMERLIEDLLALARSKEGVHNRRPIEVANIARGCWQSVDTAEATLEVQHTQTLAANETQLRQLFTNLYRNAVEHGGQAVTVEVGALENGFYVEDDGEGLPHHDHEQLLSAGFSTRPDGTGLGLHIVAKAVNAHGWDMAITDGTTGGARFEITGTEDPEPHA
jgi:signal transduction histidine kinase